MRRFAIATRGFSLLELLIAAAIVALGVSLAAGFTIDSYRGMRAQDLTRHATSSKRDATLNLETSLRLLGWGIDPRYAIDMKYNCTTTPCRDSTTGSDEIVFVTRNPLYQWFDNGQGTCTTAGGCFSGTDSGSGTAWRIESVVTGGSPSTITIKLSSGQFLEMGRVVLAVCASAANPVMLTLSQSYTGSGTAPLGALTTLTPNPTPTDPYNRFDLLQACHGTTGAGMFLVDRYRYFISNIGTPPVPWLMLDTGMDLNNNGVLPPTDTNDLIPIAKNVEDMQVAYGLYGAQTGSGCTTAPDADGDWIIGNTPGTPEEPSFAALAPIYGTPNNDPTRCTMHPANVRTIRVSLRLRSDMVDTSRGPGWAGDDLWGAENRTVHTSGGKYRRYTAETSITLRNLDSIGSFMF